MAAPSPVSLPPGWEMRVDPASGRYFYVSHVLSYDSMPFFILALCRRWTTTRRRPAGTRPANTGLPHTAITHSSTTTHNSIIIFSSSSIIISRSSISSIITTTSSSHSRSRNSINSINSRNSRSSLATRAWCKCARLPCAWRCVPFLLHPPFVLFEYILQELKKRVLGFVAEVQADGQFSQQRQRTWRELNELLLKEEMVLDAMDVNQDEGIRFFETRRRRRRRKRRMRREK